MYQVCKSLAFSLRSIARVRNIDGSILKDLVGAILIMLRWLPQLAPVIQSTIQAFSNAAWHEYKQLLETICFHVRHWCQIIYNLGIHKRRRQTTVTYELRVPRQWAKCGDPAPLIAVSLGLEGPSIFWGLSFKLMVERMKLTIRDTLFVTLTPRYEKRGPDNDSRSSIVASRLYFESLGDINVGIWEVWQS